MLSDFIPMIGSIQNNNKVKGSTKHMEDCSTMLRLHYVTGSISWVFENIIEGILPIS